MPAGSGDAWADDYERGRPGWPAAAIAIPGETVAEVAAGTGKLTRLLRERFPEVVAIEPSPAMRRHNPGARFGTAHDLPLSDGAVDAVFVAEAFHKFADADAVAELARVLRPGGTLVLLWNVPGGPWEPALGTVETLLTERGPRDVTYDPLDLDGPQYTEGRWRQAFEGSPFPALEDARFANPQELDRNGLVSFLASMGWLADMPDDERLPVLDDVRSRLPAPAYRRRWVTHRQTTTLPG
jgi:SAM-dependent methyltransferase